MIKRALVSCYDKSGLNIVAEKFKEYKTEVFSTGGTAKVLRELGLEVKDVSELTGFPEVFDGRVKTLHPNIYMSLLGRKNNPEDIKVLSEYSLNLFDCVVVNLYPFTEGLSQNLEDKKQVELIDIGGPCMLRAAAKSFSQTTVLSDPKDYDQLEQASQSVQLRRQFAGKVFELTAGYDKSIASWCKEKSPVFKEEKHLRYGENPDQKAIWSFQPGEFGLHQAQIIQGKELSYNNLLDLNAAYEVLRDFGKVKTCISVKHGNPCGVASQVSATSLEVLKASVLADPVSVFGGIIATNYEIGKEEALFITERFAECILAPAVNDEAREVFVKKKNLRVLAWPEILQVGAVSSLEANDLRSKSILGGEVQQSEYRAFEWDESQFTYLGHPTEWSDSLKKAAVIANISVSHLKSNAIAIAGAEHSLGMGMGQVNRVDAVAQSIQRVRAYHPNFKKESMVLASDAFFPFADSIEKIAEFGIKYIIQPGGSIRDKEVAEACRQNEISMILTGRRLFRH